MTPQEIEESLAFQRKKALERFTRMGLTAPESMPLEKQLEGCTHVGAWLVFAQETPGGEIRQWPVLLCPPSLVPAPSIF